jgi:uncharacterized protein
MGRAVLIAAASGRALAASARRGGYAPLVADFFGDEDTAAVAEAHIRLGHGLARGMSSGSSRRSRGLQARDRRPGPSAARDSRIGRSCSPTSRSAGRSLATDPPRSRARNWLAKRQGGAGGHHIRSAADSDGAGGTFYFQRRVEGLSVSALFLADGHRATMVGAHAKAVIPLRRRCAARRCRRRDRRRDDTSHTAAHLDGAVARLEQRRFSRPRPRL